MPRVPKDLPHLARQRERQARYRERLAAAHMPEDVDTALAGALTRLCLSVEAANPERDDPVRTAIGTILRDARDMLVEHGYDRSQASRKLMRRVRRDAAPKRGSDAHVR